MKFFALFTIALLCGSTRAAPLGQVLVDLGLTSLQSALEVTGLLDLLEGLPEATVFAPTNQAFDNAGELPGGDDLVFLLQFHAVAGAVQSGDIANELLVASANGLEIRFNIYGNGVYTAMGAPIDLANVDVATDNGFVHVVSAVMFPPGGNIYELVQANPDFSTLLAAIDIAGLGPVLEEPGPYTGFGPDNAAFDRVPDDFLGDLLENVTALTDVLYYHTAIGATVYSAGLSDGDVITMGNGGTVSITIDANGVFVNDGVSGPAQVIRANVPATNGVVHVINNVLLAPEEAK